MTHPTQPSGPGATGGLPGSGSDTPDSTGFADGSTLAEDEASSTVDDGGVAPLVPDDTDGDR